MILWKGVFDLVETLYISVQNALSQLSLLLFLLNRRHVLLALMHQQLLLSIHLDLAVLIRSLLIDPITPSLIEIDEEDEVVAQAR